MRKLKPIDLGITTELIKNPRLSDREVAKKLQVSQPTITRRRGELEKERLLDYTAIPDLAKLGFEVMAITFGNRTVQHPGSKIQKAKESTERPSNIIFSSSGLGLDSDRVVVSIHKNYSDYSRFRQEIRQEWEENLTVKGSFVISLVGDSLARNLTFKHISELMKENLSAENGNNNQTKTLARTEKK